MVLARGSPEQVQVVTAPRHHLFLHTCTWNLSYAEMGHIGQTWPVRYLTT